MPISKHRRKKRSTKTKSKNPQTQHSNSTTPAFRVTRNGDRVTLTYALQGEELERAGIVTPSDFLHFNQDAFWRSKLVELGLGEGVVEELLKNKVPNS